MVIGFVGAGRMGLPMIRRLVDEGHTVRALARSAETRSILAEFGADPASTVADAVRGARAAVVCVFTDDQVREVCLDGPLLHSLPRGATLIIHTTGSPDTAAEIAVAAAPYDIEVVDAPVSGGPHTIAAGELTVFAGGTDTAVLDARKVLAAYADPILHVGPLGTGQRVKLVNNALFAAQIGLVADAVRLGAQLGVPEKTLLSALPHASSSGRALTSIAHKNSVEAFRSSVGQFLSKDVAVARAVSAQLGADLGILDAAIAAAFPPP
ncbi:3-hydroxyisobutyrate dehydrogenase-like beta-hydroxyacid dehydrogenase [Nocardia transvalensis]|uniref:3-hydroxyisobutyrate dehydrogenase-like beta-hydroxyacid dehydrogenase n=1 Tax=Nocardia transvalensis TaxID=37333 RepID=A0A7W9PH49_9NOCA|nr:NAD(P)-dependent oxidoreductase [Nocardia transvalensis]MBB5915583.1 3-hydroxyisobutyrate dehydrogenase-like beta-hydroxyacid dehydrogenase [Nocardia transvalensis]